MSVATVSSSTTQILTGKARVSSIDIVRGIVMVIMALDHARDFFHKGGLFNDPANLATTTPALFFTRWITHFCAPAFVFLAGTSIYISSKRKSPKELSVFLLTRGFWLIVLEFVVVRFSFFFNFYYDIIIMQVIFAIGASMVCMAMLTRLPYNAILTLGLVITFGRNIFDSLSSLGGTPSDAVSGGGGGTNPLAAIFWQGGLFPLTQSNFVFVIYPLLPWLGIMLLGYCLGKLYTDYAPEQRRKMLLNLGLAAIAVFVVLRFVNVYGDPSPWKEQKNFIFTVMSFLNTTKYPISLLFALMTLGPALVLLALFERSNSKVLEPFNVIGRVPLFYYVLHFFILHAVALWMFMNRTGKSFSEIDLHSNAGFGGLTAEHGYSLGGAYLAWISVVLFLYPLCYWYNRYKSTHKNWWLSYL
jgi:uncharacterized membrane protein